MILLQYTYHQRACYHHHFLAELHSMEEKYSLYINCLNYATNNYLQLEMVADEFDV